MGQVRRASMRLAPLAGVLIYAFALVLVLELTNVDDTEDAAWWHDVLLAMALLGLPVSFVAAVAAAGGSRHTSRALLLGGLVGALTAMMGVLGWFLPYAARWGGRHPNEFGDIETAGPVVEVIILLIWFGLYGAGLGGVCGLLARGFGLAVERLPRRATPSSR